MMTVICVCVILHLKRHGFVIISAVQFSVLFTYSLAKLEEQADGGWLRATPTVWQINLFLSGFLMYVRSGFGK
jgi:uncharacterized membrane protein SirB2